LLSNVVYSIVKKVFPEGTELCLNGKKCPPESRFWMIPGKGGGPRWIIPQQPEYGLPILNQWRPYDLFSHIKWKCLLTAYRVKNLGYLPGVVPLRLIVPEKNNWEHLGWHSIKHPTPVIYVGTPGPSRKTVFGLVNSQDGAVTSYGKAPLGPSSRLAINHEVDILDTLAKEKPGRAPRIFFIDRANGLTTQEFFSGKPSGRILTENHVAFLVDLVISGETISLREVVEDLGPQIKILEDIDSKARTLLERVLEEIDDTSPLPAVWVHGDFAPWNIKKAAKGSLRVIDWEDSSRKGLPLFDLYYFHSKQMFLFGENELFPKLFGRLLKLYLEQLSIVPAMTEKIIRVCIALDWLRYHHIGHPYADFLLRTLLARPMRDLI